MSATPAWTALGWTLVHLMWVGLLLGGLAWVLRLVLARARPEVRYAGSLLCLALLALAPAVTYLWCLPGGPGEPVASLRALETAEAALPPSSGAPSARGDDGQGLEAWIPFLPWIWLSGLAITLGRLMVSGSVLGRLRRSSRPLSGEDLARRSAALARKLGVRRPVGVAVCDRIRSPALAGIVRPVILLPASALLRCTPEQLELILLHELAHARRLDNLVNLVQRLLEAVLFFHPAAWSISRWVREEREHCCDAVVLRHGGTRQSYARALFLLSRPAARLPAVAMADRHLLERVRCVLNQERLPMTIPQKLLAPTGLFAGLVLMALTVGAGDSGRPAGADPVAQPVDPGAQEHPQASRPDPHARAFTSCTACHMDVPRRRPPIHPGDPWHKWGEPVSCASCHVQRATMPGLWRTWESRVLRCPTWHPQGALGPHPRVRWPAEQTGARRPDPVLDEVHELLEKRGVLDDPEKTRRFLEHLERRLKKPGNNATKKGS